MPETKTPQLPDDILDEAGPQLPAIRLVTQKEAAVRAVRKIQPTMRNLRRILGDEVLDIFPDGFVEQIDNLYQACLADTGVWAEIELDTADERDDFLDLARAYAECASSAGYTIRQDQEVATNVARFRVVNRKGSLNIDR